MNFLNQTISIISIQKKMAAPSGMFINKITALFLIAMACSVFTGNAIAEKPLKVYILAGQSNMQGHAKISTFDYIGMDPETVSMLKEMQNADGTPRVCENVWISSIGNNGTEQEFHGKLTAGFGAANSETKIGPEFTFGIYMQKLVDEPILIIKTAWGGKSLNTDFRSPGAGPYEFNKQQLEKFKKQGKDIDKIKEDKDKAAGHYYRLMMQHVNKVLKDIKRVYPAYNPKAGYELGGFVWFQGWNDMCDTGTYPNRDKPGGYAEYSKLMAHFIRDVRKDITAPNIPFVIGVLGVSGPINTYPHTKNRYKGVHGGFRTAMAAPAKMPEFKGNVTAVLTEKYWDHELDKLRQKGNEIKSKSKALSKDKTLSRQQRNETLAKIKAEIYTPQDLEKLKGGSNFDFHYMGSAKVLARIGKAFAEATLPASKVILRPYDGLSVSGADATTLKGKVMTGYQGWFNCEGDGANLAWTHWAKNLSKPFAPGNIAVDLWPDVSEYDDDELYATAFSYPDGTAAKTFSSHNRKTVIRHFKWMRDYGIDGAFVQRFSNGLKDKTLRFHKDKVLSSAREGANRYGRTYTIMYDLTGIPDDYIIKVFDDWRMLREKMHITEDPAFQHHNGKPLVAIWGFGFNGQIKRRPGFKECTELLKKFKADGCSVMLGTATGWRAQDKDATQNPDLHKVLLMADVISPWSVGRFGTLSGTEKHAEKYWSKDVVWARDHNIDYMPVVFPGFSWHNLTGKKLASIPRLKGQFMWSQIVANKKAGADMIYIAMFDEVDEATAIFKCTDNPPTGNGGKFLTMDGLPSDFYLRLTGQAGKLLRDEIPLTETVPVMMENSHGDENIK